jgi:hypothetical protein
MSDGQKFHRAAKRLWDVKTFCNAFFAGWDSWIADDLIEFDKPMRDRRLAPFVSPLIRPANLASIMGIDDNDEPLTPIMIKRVPTFRHVEIDLPWDPTRYRKD